jgi:predicted RNA-binding protein
MCLSKVFVDRKGKRELLMEEVASVEIGGDKLLFKTLFGEQKEIEANIREIDFLSHSLFLEKIRGG